MRGAARNATDVSIPEQRRDCRAESPLLQTSPSCRQRDRTRRSCMSPMTGVSRRSIATNDVSRDIRP